MRVAIGGSSGFLGTALTRRLLRNGHEVVRLVRGRPAAADQRRWDPDAGRIFGPGLEDVDAVVNLAGGPIASGRWTKERKAELRRSRVTATLTIVTSLTPNGRCQRLLNGSAVGYYGDTGIEVVDETWPQGRGFLAGLVADWEAAASHSPVPTVTVRTGQVLAREGGFLARLWPIFALGLGGRIGDGRQFLSWISLADHVRAMEHLLTSELTGPVNLTAPVPVSNAEFTQALGDRLNRPSAIPMPLSPMSLVLGREFVTEALRFGQRARPARLLEDGFAFDHLTVQQALAAIEPTSRG